MSDLVVGQFRGFRAWRVAVDSQLMAPTRNDVWLAAETMAHCRLHQNTHHLAPGRDCQCGLYAYYRATTVPVAANQVFGVVSVAGRVILATRGMKAERMTILGLVSDDAGLGQRYGVPLYPSREALLSDYPPQDYSELVDVDPTDPPDFGSLRVTLGVDLRRFGVAMQEAARAMRETAARRAASVQEAKAAYERSGLIEKPLSKDAMARALEARRRRNTGPPVGRYRLDGRRY